MKKLVIFVDKRGFGVYPYSCSPIVAGDKLRRDKHCEIRERIIINWLKRQMRCKGENNGV